MRHTLMACVWAACAATAHAKAPLQPVWVPTAHDGAPDHRVLLRQGVGFQSLILAPESPQSGLGLSGLPVTAWGQAQIRLNQEPLGALTSVTFTTGVLFNYDNTLPMSAGLRLLWERPDAVSLAVVPRVISGVDMNTATLELHASRRWARAFTTAGVQVGVAQNPPTPRALGAAVGAAGVEVVDDTLAITLEGVASLHRRYGVSSAAVLRAGATRLSAGAGIVSVGGRISPMVQGAVDIPLLRIPAR